MRLCFSCLGKSGLLPSFVASSPLAALTYHYETQCIPTPLAWFAHQLPVWWQKLSVVGTFVIEIPVPLLFFSPVRRLRLGSFYLQVGGNPGVLSKKCYRTAAFVFAHLCTLGFWFFAGFASSSHHFVGQLQLLQPADFDALPVTSGRPTRPLLVAQETHQQREWYEQKYHLFFFFLSSSLPCEQPAANVTFVLASLQALLRARGSVTCWS